MAISALRPRVAIEDVRPAVEGGRFPARRTVGDRVTVEADLFADGTDVVVGEVVSWRDGDGVRHAPMREVGNDRFAGGFPVERPGRYRFTVRGWVDPIASWRNEVGRWAMAGDVESRELRAGVELLRREAERAGPARRTDLLNLARELEHEIDRSPGATVLRLLAPSEEGRWHAEPASDDVATFRPELEVIVDPARARHSAWYELFPRSTAPVPGRSGRFSDVERWLPHIADLGFDVLYLPPIHPIGRTRRKGANNSEEAGPADPGSPWAIGDRSGGHTSIHPELGSLEEFRHLVHAAHDRGLEIALDVALQCSPDHPWVREHPEWFRRRPDGSIRPAENPPKRYEDVLPLDFGTPEWRALWEELRRVVMFWAEQGVTRFRVDNPHTKPFAFWEWLIGEVRAEHPETLFLAEAFTRPKVMYRLARVGFTHSYTYFAWRNDRAELTQYFDELVHGEPAEYFRPHLWPNTPDILTGYLQEGGRPALIARLVLAATLVPNYGIYGPPYEHEEVRALHPGQEEYLDSEKYRIHHWDRDGGPLSDVIRRVNRARRENPALLAERNLSFERVDNPALLAYFRWSVDGRSRVLVVVNLDPHRAQAGTTDLRLDRVRIDWEEGFTVHDLLTDRRYPWRGARNYVELRPWEMPAHIFRIEPGGPGGDAGG